MMKVFTKYLLLFAISLTGLVSCNNSVEFSPGNQQETEPVNNSDEWLIPEDEVVDGGPGRDGIPSVDEPHYARADTINYYEEERLVVGVKINNTIKAYPHQVLDYHEIVNAKIDDEKFSVTYCPLTGTAICWYRTNVKEFGVSGLLFRNNLIVYDRSTGSRYSQMQMRAVNGSLSGTNLETIPVVQTTWATWKSMYPKSLVLTTDTGYDRNYSRDLYGEKYREEDSATLFPVKNVDNRLPSKKRVHGVILGSSVNEESKSKVYVIDDFGNEVNLIEDHFGDRITVAGSQDKNFAVSFFNKLKDGTQLRFEPVQDSLPIIMKDQEGNYWDIFGFAVEGPRKGSRLTSTNSYNGYWFAWADFFPNIEIHQSN
jgi:hypothetical protein